MILAMSATQRLAPLVARNLRPHPHLLRAALAASTPRYTRRAHSIPRPPPLSPTAISNNPETHPAEAPASESKRPPRDPAYYQLSFTCIPCQHRSHHNVSKQGYHKGSVLISCPACRNRHVISDHLSIFGDTKMTVEDLLRERGELVKRGSLGEDGDIEFWVDEKEGAKPEE